jgi:hypothetical protein
MQRTLSADPTFNWAAQAHLKAAKQSSSFSRNIDGYLSTPLTVCGL